MKVFYKAFEVKPPKEAVEIYTQLDKDWVRLSKKHGLEGTWWEFLETEHTNLLSSGHLLEMVNIYGYFHDGNQLALMLGHYMLSKQGYAIKRIDFIDRDTYMVHPPTSIRDIAICLVNEALVKIDELSGRLQG